MKREYSLLIIGGLFLFVGYFFEKQSTAASTGLTPAQVAAVQAPGPGNLTIGQLPLTGSVQITSLQRYSEVV